MAPTDQDLLAGADARIEEHRKSDGTVTVTGQDGMPVVGAKVRIEQERHAFLFGCGSFPLLENAKGEEEALYEREFTALFNYATLPFYWGGYEPEPGRTRERKLEEQARWLRRRGIEIKGHPLVWHLIYPPWAPSDPDGAREALLRRVRDIVGRFSGLIDRWDVVNEAASAHEHDNGEGAWFRRDGALKAVGEALDAAHRANPLALLLYNDFKLGEAYEDLARELVRQRKPVGAFGVQSHMHAGDWPLTKAWQACETYARFGKPVHFTELTAVSGQHGWELPAPWSTTPEGEARQAEYVESLYRVLFSHPAVEAITWWELADGGWQGAPSGLVRADLTPKPAYDRLLALVKDRWWTRLDTETGLDGQARFRGFAGHYRVTVTKHGATTAHEMDLRPHCGGSLDVLLR